MKLSNVETCPKCLGNRPFIEDQREVKPGEDEQAICRHCGANVEVTAGKSATIVKESRDRQRKLF